MKKAGIVRINDIVDYIAAYYPDADFDLIRKAYIFFLLRSIMDRPGFPANHILIIPSPLP